MANNTSQPSFKARFSILWATLVIISWPGVSSGSTVIDDQTPIDIETSSLGTDTSLQTFSLSYALAKNLIPVIRPLLQPGETVTGVDQKLVVKAEAATHREIEKLLRELDHPPKNLVIEVRSNANENHQSESFGVSGTIRKSRVRLDTGEPIHDRHRTIEHRDGSQVRIESTHTQRRTTRNGNQKLRVLEGHPAFVATGQLTPVTTRHRRHLHTELYPVTQGFYVIARTAGERIQIVIELSDDTLSENPSSTIETTELSTQLSGRMNEWIDLGRITDRHSSQSRPNALSRRQEQFEHLRGYAIRVSHPSSLER